MLKEQSVGDKAKGRISKRAFQESKARQNFRKTNISYPSIRTYQGVRNVCISEILSFLFVFRKFGNFYARFEIRPFALLPTKGPFCNGNLN